MKMCRAIDGVVDIAAALTVDVAGTADDEAEESVAAAAAAAAAADADARDDHDADAAAANHFPTQTDCRLRRRPLRSTLSPHPQPGRA